jgi:hypothetical protein
MVLNLEYHSMCTYSGAQSRWINFKFNSRRKESYLFYCITLIISHKTIYILYPSKLLWQMTDSHIIHFCSKVPVNAHPMVPRLHIALTTKVSEQFFKPNTILSIS